MFVTREHIKNLLITSSKSLALITIWKVVFYLTYLGWLRFCWSYKTFLLYLLLSHFSLSEVWISDCYLLMFFYKTFLSCIVYNAILSHEFDRKNNYFGQSSFIFYSFLCFNNELIQKSNLGSRKIIHLSSAVILSLFLFNYSSFIGINQ